MDRPSSLSFKAGEIVYNIDTNSNEAYIITEGEENFFSRDGFLPASLSNGEMFGETSVITGKNRSITAKAGANGLKVTIVPKSNLTNILQKDLEQLHLVSFLHRPFLLIVVLRRRSRQGRLFPLELLVRPELALIL